MPDRTYSGQFAFNSQRQGRNAQCVPAQIVDLACTDKILKVVFEPTHAR